MIFLPNLFPNSFFPLSELLQANRSTSLRFTGTHCGCQQENDKHNFRMFDGNRNGYRSREFRGWRVSYASNRLGL